MRMPVLAMSRTKDGLGSSKGNLQVDDIWLTPPPQDKGGKHLALPLANCSRSLFRPIGESPPQLQRLQSSPVVPSRSVSHAGNVLRGYSPGATDDSGSIAEFTFEKYRLLCAEATSDLAFLSGCDLGRPSELSHARLDVAVEAGDGDGGAGPQPSGVSGPRKSPPLAPWPDPIISSADTSLARRTWRLEAGLEVTARRAWTVSPRAEEEISAARALQPLALHACPLPLPVPSTRADQEAAARRARDVARELERLVDAAIERKLAERESVKKMLESLGRAVAAAIPERSRRVSPFRRN